MGKQRSHSLVHPVKYLSIKSCLSPVAKTREGWALVRLQDPLSPSLPSQQDCGGVSLLLSQQRQPGAEKPLCPTLLTCPSACHSPSPGLDRFALGRQVLGHQLLPCPEIFFAQSNLTNGTEIPENTMGVTTSINEKGEGVHDLGDVSPGKRGWRVGMLIRASKSQDSVLPMSCLGTIVVARFSSSSSFDVTLHRHCHTARRGRLCWALLGLPGAGRTPSPSWVGLGRLWESQGWRQSEAAPAGAVMDDGCPCRGRVRFLQVLVLCERLWAASPKHGERAELGI